MWTRGGKEDESLLGADVLMNINNKSLGPVIDHGDKSYMLHLGMAHRVNREDDIDFNTPCCVKPLSGSKGKDVQIWMPKQDGTREASFLGGATRSQVLRTIKSSDCIQQPFIPTGTELIGGVPHFKLMRLFAVMNDEMKYEIIPSPYVMRPNAKIHGASDAINGLITFS